MHTMHVTSNIIVHNNSARKMHVTSNKIDVKYDKIQITYIICICILQNISH